MYHLNGDFSGQVKSRPKRAKTRVELILDMKSEKEPPIREIVPPDSIYYIFDEDELDLLDDVLPDIEDLEDIEEREENEDGNWD